MNAGEEPAALICWLDPEVAFGITRAQTMNITVVFYVRHVVLEERKNVS
jgi:hypothetical protein